VKCHVIAADLADIALRTHCPADLVVIGEEVDDGRKSLDFAHRLALRLAT
jgi:hypothetical protein